MYKGCDGPGSDSEPLRRCSCRRSLIGNGASVRCADPVTARSGDAVMLPLSVCTSTVAVSAASGSGAAVDPSVTDRLSTAAVAAAARPSRWRQSDDQSDDNSGSRAVWSARITLPTEGKPYDRRDFIDRVEETVGLNEGDRGHWPDEPGECVDYHIPDRRRSAARRRRGAFLYPVVPCCRRRLPVEQVRAATSLGAIPDAHGRHHHRAPKVSGGSR